MASSLIRFLPLSIASMASELTMWKMLAVMPYSQQRFRN